MNDFEFLCFILGSIFSFLICLFFENKDIRELLRIKEKCRKLDEEKLACECEVDYLKSVIKQSEDCLAAAECKNKGYEYFLWNNRDKLGDLVEWPDYDTSAFDNVNDVDLEMFSEAVHHLHFFDKLLGDEND